MEILEIKGGECVRYKSIYGICPKYGSKEEGQMRFSPDGFLGIRSYATVKYIYALKRRKSREEKAGYKSYHILYNDELEVYD